MWGSVVTGQAQHGQGDADVQAAARFSLNAHKPIALSVLVLPQGRHGALVQLLAVAKFAVDRAGDGYNM